MSEQRRRFPTHRLVRLQRLHLLDKYQQRSHLFQASHAGVCSNSLSLKKENLLLFFIFMSLKLKVIVLKAHKNEVTAVDWNPMDANQVICRLTKIIRLFHHGLTHDIKLNQWQSQGDHMLRRQHDSHLECEARDGLGGQQGDQLRHGRMPQRVPIAKCPRRDNNK